MILKSYEIKPEEEIHSRILKEETSVETKKVEEKIDQTLAIAQTEVEVQPDAALAVDQNSEAVLEETVSLTYPEFFKRYPKLVFLALGTVFLMFSQSFVNTFFIQVITPVGGNNAAMGTAIFIAGAVEFPVIMSLGTLTKKISVAKLIKISTIFFLVKNILLLLAPNMMWVYVSQFLSFGANALASPTLVQYINEIVDLKDLVKGQSLATIGIALSGVFASFLGGIMIDTLGVKMALFIGIITTVIGALAVVFFAREPHTHTKEKLPTQNQVGLVK